MIPFLDLKAQYRSIRGEIDEAVAGVLESGEYVLGEEVRRFEQEFARLCGCRHGVAVNSGTSALHLALLAAGVGPGDEVITVPFTFVATVAAIEYTGASPRFVDVDPLTLTMDPARLAHAIGPRTRAIVPVHLYGHPADMDPILEIARERRLAVVEDAAQAHGARYKGCPVGGLGDLGCFSFYPGKNLGAYGEGGIVVTDSDEHQRRLRMLRDWGAERKYEHTIRGFNYRMDAIQGAILRVKLRHLAQWTRARRERARCYDALLDDSGLHLPVRSAHCEPVHHVYAIRTRRREALRAHLAARGVATGIHYPTPVHRLAAYADLGLPAGTFPNSEAAAAEVLSLPLYPEMPFACCETVAAQIRTFMAASRGAPASVATLGGLIH